MPLSGNKGEWSEIYAFLRLLAEGLLYEGDEKGNLEKDFFYPIVRIMRQERRAQMIYGIEKGDVVVCNDAGEELLRLPMSLFSEKASDLFEQIKSKRGTFALASIEEFLSTIHCFSIKALSTSKADIHIVVHDPRTLINPILNFSIKSQLGGDATLLNASQSTNFIFSVKGGVFSAQDIAEINAIEGRTKVIERYKAIRMRGGHLVYTRPDSTILLSNLRMLDGDLPLLVALLLLEQLESTSSSLPILIEKIADRNVLNLAEDNELQTSYTYKVKHLLTSIALGMMPATKWRGIFDANGGYLVVKKNGEIVCYNFYNRNKFEDYLFQNAYLERASTTRNQYAKLYHDENGALSFKLNLQIRLKLGNKTPLPCDDL